MNRSFPPRPGQGPGGADFRSVFERLPTAGMVVDENRRVLAINREARRLTGATRKAIGRRTCRELCRCQIPPERCPLKAALARNKPLYRSPLPVCLAPDIRTLIERVSPLPEAPGRPRRAVLLFGDATRHMRRLHALKKRGRLDPLTGVLSRGYFEELWARGAGRDRRRKPSAFLMVDVDGLKQINDRFGHQAGDRLLRRLGRLLSRAARASDLVGRLGGDEFAVYCPDTARSEAQGLAARIREAVERDNAARPSAPALRVGIGLASSRGGRGRELRRRADIELYRYKNRRPSSPEAAPRVGGSD